MKGWKRIGIIVGGIASAIVLDGFSVLYAQSIPNLVIDSTGTCPGQPDLVRINPALDEGSVGGLVNRIATPSQSGLRLYRAQTLSEPAVQGVTLTFDDEVEVLIGAVLEQAGGGPALVKRLRDPVCGWLNVADLERFIAPKLLRDIPGFRGEVDRLGQANTLEARVVVKNRIDRQSGHAQRAPLFNASFTGDEPPENQRRGSVGYFEVLSVYDVKRHDGQACRVFRDPDCFLRVGSSASLAGRAATGLTRTRGWMRGSDVEIWPSALAVYYGRGKQGLKIHLTEPSARVGTPFAAADARESILAYQPEGSFEEPRERNIMRFPVIRGTPYTEPASPPRPGAPAPATSASYGYEIVFNGQACIEKSSGGASDCIPEPLIKDQVARLGQAMKAISNIDVLFVVDTTESMGPYLRSIVRAVRRHVERATTNREWSFRYSIVVYGDYNRAREGGLDYFALPFSSDIGNLDQLEKIGTYDDENKDKPEAPFAALERAASTAAWRTEAANRLIIWIGDHGNRAPGKYTTPAGELIETKTAQSVIDAIQGADARLRGSATATGGGTKTRFVAIQVQGGANAASQGDFRKFKQDADAIGRGIGETAFANIPATSSRSDQEVSALVGSVARQIDKSVDAIADARQLVQGALGGDTSGLQSNLAPSALLAREFLAQLGFPPERLREMGRRIQVVRNGFVFQSGRNPDYRYWLGLRQPEFADILKKARELCENMAYPDRVAVVEGSILSLVRAVTFTEMRQGESVRSFFTRIFSVPASALSPMLGEGTPADFVRSWAGWTPAQREQSIIAACKKARILQYVGDGQIVEERDLQWERNRIVLRQGVVPKDFDWRWITADAQSVWFFVPMDVLP